MMNQMSLFAPRRLAADLALITLAASVPEHVRFGTSSWSFPGWEGLVYADKHSSEALAADGLAEYARHPLLRTVGIDRSFYAPIPEADYARYHAQLPAGFRCALKMPQLLTLPVFHAHQGGPVGLANPDFLSPEKFCEWMARPLRATFAEHVGPLIFEFSPVAAQYRLSAHAFSERLDTFLSELPRDLPYAVELRERSHFTPAYRRVLERHEVAHVYNYWSAMPSIAAQMEAIPPAIAPHAVSRLLLAPGTKYEAQRALFKPFNRVVAPDPAMRTQVVALLRAAQGPVYVLVNNKAEGCAPLTIRALAETLVGR